MRSPVSRAALVLCVLTGLFGARVVGQALVAFLGVTWLPAMDAWYSGLLPYPVLLPIQIAILLVQVVVDRDVWLGRGFFARPRAGAGRALQWAAWIYAFAMVVRYAVMRSHPIPIVFHWVLAAYLFTLGRFMSVRRAREQVEATDRARPATRADLTRPRQGSPNGRKALVNRCSCSSRARPAGDRGDAPG